ncbi:hypothetical protein SELR_03110 [Selenomonas ruminantium subsp. lactilytica TAM6421]|uniref:Deacetylase PdaC domain-containing protein n=1 Tax=Selenomonas ruminantium subsp. lactilytica (strain NBRC 103574 / TAM6421) TaxID=927704 RepID=I0GMN2_SELRL|nr:hypothetical protein [Selenomonas ruminantium]BAL82019.1 hypothetical protein SELR_03110 [Selenomonas ruminantium subsp. lactilytica TAM6421]
MKRILLFVMVLYVIFVNTAFASISKISESGVSYQIEYPQLDSDDKNIADMINNDIKKYVNSFKVDYNNGKFYEGQMKFETKYEDDNYLSIIFNDSRTYQAHYRPQNKYIGLNYNKRTGEKIPLRYFVHIGTDDSYTIRECPLYNSANKKIDRYEFSKGSKLIRDNYFLYGGGTIALIYQVHERGCHADGMTYAVLDLKTIDYLNRKNP